MRWGANSISWIKRLGANNVSWLKRLGAHNIPFECLAGFLKCEFQMCSYTSASHSGSPSYAINRSRGMPM